MNRVRSVRARLTGGVVPRPPRPAAEPSPTAQPEQPVPPVDHGTPGPQGTEDGVGRWQRFQEVAVPLARRGAAATVQLASVVMAAFVAAFVWSRARVSRLAARRAERKAARATGVETGNSAAPRARWTGWTWIGESVFRLCWWGALALFAVGGQTLFAVRGGDPIAAALPLFVAGFALCALVLLIAPHARRLRWGAFALGAGHGALALLAAIVSWTQIY